MLPIKEVCLFKGLARRQRPAAAGSAASHGGMQYFNLQSQPFLEVGTVCASHADVHSKPLAFELN